MDYLDECKLNMEEVIETLDKRLSQVRAGRANPGMLSGVFFEAYGSVVPLNNVANINIPEARQIMIKPFDRSLIKEIEKGINESNLGLTPNNNGEMIILTLPELTEDRRREYVKLAKTIGEEAKIAIRNARQEANETIKKDKLPEDEEKSYLEEVQNLTNKYNKVIDEKVKDKENELMSF